MMNMNIDKIKEVINVENKIKGRIHVEALLKDGKIIGRILSKEDNDGNIDVALRLFYIDGAQKEFVCANSVRAYWNHLDEAISDCFIKYKEILEKEFNWVFIPYNKQSYYYLTVLKQNGIEVSFIIA